MTSPGAPAPAAKTNTLSIVALVLSFFCGLLGIILGVVAKNQIKETGEGGDGLATAAIVIGVVTILGGILYNIVVLS